MNDYNLVSEKIGKLLRQHRFALIRQEKHLVWQQQGERRIFVCAKTPSDWRAERNAIASLKRCISSPPAPMVTAISDFERQEAAEKIAAQPQRQARRAGTGSGKQRRSTSTGFKYIEERVLTEEEIRAQEQTAAKARELVGQRWERKLQRRQERAARRGEVQKQILLESINEMLTQFAQLRQNPSLPIIVEAGGRVLFESTVGAFANLFGDLRWQEIDDEVRIIFGDENCWAVCRTAKLRNTSDSVTRLGVRTLSDGTVTTECLWQNKLTAFHVTKLVDGTQTVERLEHSDGEIDFGFKRTPDGTERKERVEFPSGEVLFGVTRAPNNGIMTVDRVKLLDGVVRPGYTLLPNGTRIDSEKPTAQHDD